MQQETPLSALVPPRVEDRKKAVMLFLAAVAFLATMDMMVKLASTHYATPQIIWARYIAQLLAMLLITGRVGIAACLNSKAPALHVLRALALFGANFAFMAAVRYLPLAEANVLSFAAPLLLTALTWPVLGERAGFVRWIAVFTGFAGVVIVAEPGTAVFHWAVLLPLLTAVGSAIYHVLTPVVARVESPSITISYLAVIGSVSMSIAVPWFWTRPDALGWALLLAIGVLGTIGHLLLLRAFAHAQASMLAPFFYVHLLWAIVYGWIIFGDLPTLATIAGGSLIVASGYYVYRSS